MNQRPQGVIGGAYSRRVMSISWGGGARGGKRRRTGPRCQNSLLVAWRGEGWVGDGKDEKISREKEKRRSRKNMGRKEKERNDRGRVEGKEEKKRDREPVNAKGNRRKARGGTRNEGKERARGSSAGHLR